MKIGNVWNISTFQETMPIDELILWLEERKAQGDNVINIEPDWGYYDSLDGIDLRTEQIKPKRFAELKKRFELLKQIAQDNLVTPTKERKNG